MMSSNIGKHHGNGERKTQLSYLMVKHLILTLATKSIKGKRFSISKGISLYVKSGDNEIYRIEPEKEIIGWKGLLACLLIGFLIGFFVLPLIFG